MVNRTSVFCIDAGTPQAQCLVLHSKAKQRVCNNSCSEGECIACTSDDDCGGTSQHDVFVCEDNKVVLTVKGSSCINPGTAQSWCTYGSGGRVMDVCTDGEVCSNGACVVPCTSTCIASQVGHYRCGSSGREVCSIVADSCQQWQAVSCSGTCINTKCCKQSCAAEYSHSDYHNYCSQWVN
jgi:hypothetical protein